MFDGPKATSSSTVGMKSWLSESWKTSPTDCRTSGRVLRVSVIPPITTSPCEGISNPSVCSSRVDFPAPLAPTRATFSPCVMRNDTPRSAS